LESDFQISYAGFVAEAELEELVDFAATESRESRKFVDNYNIQVSVFNVRTETLVLLTAVSLGPTDGVCVGVDGWLFVHVLSELP
jgi:hypothetical protein